MNRFDHREETQWNRGAFDDGASARIDNQPRSSAPSADVIGDWCHRSWLAGWADADAGLLADRAMGAQDGAK